MIRLRRKALIPLATALAAGAVAVGSGATFTSQSNSATSFTTGALTQTNDHAALFDVLNMKPGDTYDGSVTIKNTGSLGQTFSLTESGASNPFGSALTLTITEGSTQLYSGAFDALPASSTLGTWQPAESHTYKFSVALASSVDNALQGAKAAATFTWNGTQTAGSTYN